MHPEHPTEAGALPAASVDVESQHFITHVPKVELLGWHFHGRHGEVVIIQCPVSLRGHTHSYMFSLGVEMISWQPFLMRLS